LVFVFNYSEYWFLYGFVSFYVALRFGFGPVLITNLYIVILVYFLPRFFIYDPESPIHSNDLGKFLFAANSMFVFAVLASRVISDLRDTQTILQEQFNELKRTNQELDKFVYSISHDLTAPLKSILGLVAISEFTNDPKDLKDCLGKVEKSVHKLEGFIDQSLDYSRNNRQFVLKQPVDIRKICTEIIDDLKEAPLAPTVDFRFDLKEDVVYQDTARLRIVLKNLLSNAVKFQKVDAFHRPYVKISSWKTHGKVFIEIEDNGEGIHGTEQGKIFDMFHRANARSQGSGLGLYIAKETVAVMQGSIRVESYYGIGSKFTIVLTT
jgi:two-component system, sensor histidine kinase